MEQQDVKRKSADEPTPKPSQEGNDWDGCDKLADLMCDFPHCTCGAMAVGGMQEADGRGGKRQKADGRRSKTGLLPCPFCGSVRLSGLAIPEMNEEAVSDPDAEQAACFIQCEDCNCTGPARKTFKQARALWQTRAQEV